MGCGGYLSALPKAASMRRGPYSGPGRSRSPGIFRIEAPAQRAKVTGLVGDQAATRPAGPSTGPHGDIGDVACRQPQNSRALQQSGKAWISVIWPPPDAPIACAFASRSPPWAERDTSRSWSR